MGYCDEKIEYLIFIWVWMIFIHWKNSVFVNTSSHKLEIRIRSKQNKFNKFKLVQNISSIMVHSKFPNRIKKQDQTPILVNDSLEENVFASENIQYEGMIIN